ncbi:MAG TPA: low-specificity L-threonine aldolase [Thermoleophilia bacterium]|nr:low-specificity L-threonine aldolase [Thermoleophilia bacterium]
MRTIDLRSDTVTRPSPEMRAAMLEAEVGDDVLGDDPTVLALQEHAAELLGKEAALYFPSGTMCNQAAVRALTGRGDEVFLHAQAHIVFYEQGGASALSQVQLRVFDSPDGTLDLEKMEEYVHTDADVHWAPTRLVCLEQTHNHCGGVVLPLEHILAVRAFCDRHGLGMHLDGARLFNAVAATGVSAADYAAPFDTVSVCLSKGLGAPVGSLLVTDAATLPAAARARKVLGGGMRQAGVIAAGGLYALRHNVARLADDHRRARRLAEALAELPGLDVDLGSVQTNMVFAGTRGTGVPAAELVGLLAAEGVLCLDEAPWSVRFVTHLDVDDDDVEVAVTAAAKALRTAVGRSPV